MLNITAGNPEELLQSAVASHNAGDLPAAEKIYRQILASNPNHPVALNLLGVVALQARQPYMAVDLFRKSLEQRPDYASAHANLASALQNASAHEEALIHCRLAIELDPANTQPKMLLPELLAQLYRVTLPDPDPTFAAPLAQLAARCVRTNPYAAARLYERALDQNPEQPAVLAALGHVLIKTRQPQLAADAFRAALAMNHQTSDAYHGLAQALHKAYEFPAAIEAANRAIQLDPNNLDAQWTLTQIQTDVHKFQVAEKNLRAALARDPANQDLQFQLAALTGDASLSSLPNSQIAATFDKYAANFDSHLVGRLNYKGPDIILAAVQAAAPARTFDILDLGCGTGLCGAALKPLAKSLAGIDLSPAMIERCRQRTLYDQLEVSDALTALRRHASAYDLITAADVFEYIGDLADTFAAATAALRPGGLFAFSVERTDHPRFLLNRTTMRFCHNLDYLLELARTNQLSKISVDATPLRTNFGRPVAAWTLLLQRPG